MTGLREVCRRVEHVDTDAAGVVHFSRYASLLETAVLENLDRLGAGVQALGGRGLDLAVRELRLTYSAPARFLDPLRIAVRVDRVAGAVCQLSGSVHRDRAEHLPATLLADGALTLCVVDRADGRPVALPTTLRQVLLDCLNGGDRG